MLLPAHSHAVFPFILFLSATCILATPFQKPLHSPVFPLRASTWDPLQASAHVPHDRIAARIEITSPPNARFPCGAKESKEYPERAKEEGEDIGPRFWSGYGHLPTLDLEDVDEEPVGLGRVRKRGAENKHTFWMLFTSPTNHQQKPTVLFVGGGPGSSGLGFGFGGAGPCMIKTGENGKGHFGRSEHAWTEDVNMLLVDHPVATGWSYADSPSFLSNNSRDAGYELDQLLQGLFAEFDWMQDNEFHVHSGSYGGTFVPNIVSAIHHRNLEMKAAATTVDLQANESGGGRGRGQDRILIKVDSVMLVNPWSDPLSQVIWYTTHTCDDLNVFNSSSCAYLNSLLPACTDAVRLAYDRPTIESRVAAQRACAEFSETRLARRNTYDARQTACAVFPEEEGVPACFPFNVATELWNTAPVRALIGVPDHQHFESTQMKLVNDLYEARADEIQEAYKLLSPLLEETGMRLLVYSGMQDSNCHWRSTEGWMKLLRSPYQAEFLAAKDEVYHDAGFVRKVGEGAGKYTLFKVEDAGHVVIASQPALVKHMMQSWINDVPMF